VERVLEVHGNWWDGGGGGSASLLRKRERERERERAIVEVLCVFPGPESLLYVAVDYYSSTMEKHSLTHRPPLLSASY
jgi:hypothetical protein